MWDVRATFIHQDEIFHPTSMLPMTLYHQPIWPTATQPSNANIFVMQPTSCILPTFNCFISPPLFELSFSYTSIVHCPTGQGNYLLTDSFESKPLSFYVIIYTQFRSANRATCRSVLENHELQWGGHYLVYHSTGPLTYGPHKLLCIPSILISLQSFEVIWPNSEWSLFRHSCPN